MRIAKSAKAERALGATLVACMMPIVSIGATAGSSGTLGINSGDVVQGINSGDVVQGINSGDVLGINSGDVVLGINSGDVVLGINSGDVVQGINSGDVVLGINSGDVLGINSGDVVLGINSGDVVQGINSGDVVLGIISGDVVQGINSGDVVLGINSGDRPSVVLAGPVEAIDTVNGVFTAVGQTVMASQAMLSSMQTGDFVTVTGSVAGPGWLYADEVEVSAVAYVPGATEVFVSGMPNEVDQLTGRVHMGDLSIDFTAAMANGHLDDAMLLGFRGIQPNVKGTLVSDTVYTR